MRTLHILLVLVLSYASAVAAQPREDTLNIADERFEQPLSFNVQLPKSYATKPDKRYVLLFDFHPYAKTYLTGLHDWMSHNGEWPWLETIIVTPNYGNPVGRLFDASGETTPLIDFIARQLIPSIDKRYRTNGFRIMSGFRTNGTLALSMLLTHPESFNAYVVVSPELKNDHAKVLSKLAKKGSLSSEQHQFLFFAHASTIKEDHQMPAYQQLDHELKKYLADHQYLYQDFGEHYFMSLPALSMITAIEALFSDIHRGLAANSVVSQQGVNAIINHYKALSENKYGFHVSPKRSIETLGFALLKETPSKGLAVLKENINTFPEDAYAYHAVAKAYDQIGDLQSAVNYQQKAAKLAKNMLTWHQKRQQKYLAEYTSKLNAL